MTSAWARRLPMRFSRRAWLQLLALAIAIGAALPLLQHGALLNTRGGGDSPFLLQRTQQLVAALADGHFPVRWMPDAAYGYGYPFFNYYAPLSIYVAAFFRFLGAPFTAAIQLSQLSAFLLAAWAAFALAWRWLRDDWAALLASAAYTLAPFHLLNVYVRGDSLAEFWAMAFYPLVLLAADRLLVLRAPDSAPGTESVPTAKLLRLVPLALAYAALILSHNISALIFSPFLLLYILFVAWPAPRQALLRAGGALLLGLALSAWFWIPALGEAALAQTDPVTAGYFHFSNHFRGADLVQPSFLFDWQVAGQAAFRMGLAQLLLIVAGLLALLWRARRAGKSQRPRLLALTFTVAMLLIATFMITPLSRRLWESLPLLPYTQFPWRFLSVQALAGALLSGGLALLPGRRVWALAGVALLLLAMLLPLRVDPLPVRDADVTPLRLAQYEWFTGNIGATVSAEYLPHAVQPRPYTSAWLNRGERDAVQALSGEATARLQSRQATRQSWQVHVSGEQALLEFPTLYWPGWQARLDGAPVPISAAPGSGLIAVELPAGEHSLQLALARTPLRLAAELLSLAALLVLGVLLLGNARRLLACARRRRRLLLAPVVFVIVAVFISRLPLGLAAGAPTPNFNWDFAQMGYLHRAPHGVPFADGARLAAYHFYPAPLAAGQTLHVTLIWEGDFAPGAQATLSLTTPAANRFAHAPPLASATQPLRRGEISYALTAPANAPPGLYVLRLQREAAALTPSGQARGPLFLQPLHVVTGVEAPPSERPLDARLDAVVLPAVQPTPGDSAAGLFDCAANAPSAGALELQLAWFTAHPLAQNLTASLRLNGAAGERIAQCDMQPGYGFLPSGGWQAGVWTPDRLALPLPPALPPAAPYVLLVTLYDETGAAWLTRRLGQLQWQEGALAFTPHTPNFTLPPGVTPLDARFGDALALRGYELAQEGDRLRLLLYWQALQPPEEELVRFVHLLADENGAPLAQQDGAPQNNSYPVSQWAAGEIVADPVTLDVANLAAGDLLLAVGFYPPHDATARLPVSDGQGDPLPGGRLLIRP